MKYEPEECRWCGGKQRAVSSPRSREDWKRVMCCSCGTISYPKLPDDEGISTLYEEAWSCDSESCPNGSTSLTAAKDMMETILRGRITDRDVLDYGAGNGVFALALASSAAKSVFAYEPYGPTKEIDGIVWSDQPDGPWSSKRFDLIVMSEVIEHLPDPVVVLRRLKALLQPGGTIFVTTPNARGLWGRFGKGDWREAQNPSHLCLFTEVSMNACAKEAGFSRFVRVKSKVRYKANAVKQALLTVLQRTGCDGGLRGFMER